MRTLTTLLVLMASIAVTASGVFASGEHEHMEHKGSMMEEKGSMAEKGTEHGDLVKVNNTLCPVSGQPVGEMGDPIPVEYEGKLYNLCCKMCVKDFKKNPEKYSKIAEEQAKSAGMEEGYGEMMEDDGHDHQH